MKKYFLSFLIFLVPFNLGAQTYEMRVLKEGTVLFAQDISSIDSIIFVEIESTSIINEYGVLNGVFSVGSNKKVRFSRGNLQYQASSATWRFAEHQYDYVGAYKNGTVYVDDVKSTNTKISSTYSGWIDLFGWGTSGYKGCSPYLSVFNTGIYGNPGTNYVDLTGTNYDWGQYCIISNASDTSGLWHTMTTEEWTYLFHTRGNANYLRGFASIDGNNGYVILPDNWTAIATPAFIPSANDYTTNVYTIEEWQVLENAGAIFLPAAGFRWETDVTVVNSAGYYWSATANVEASADRVKITTSNGINVADYAMRNSGQAVRLVQFVNNEE